MCFVELVWFIWHSDNSVVYNWRAVMLMSHTQSEKYRLFKSKSKSSFHAYFMRWTSPSPKEFHPRVFWLQLCMGTCYKEETVWLILHQICGFLFCTCCSDLLKSTCHSNLCSVMCYSVVSLMTEIYDLTVLWRHSTNAQLLFFISLCQHQNWQVIIMCYQAA